MIAKVEQLDGSYKRMDMGDPVCGEDFCDGCGDCLACQEHGKEEWCGDEVSIWVIYLDDKRNPNYK